MSPIPGSIPQQQYSAYANTPSFMPEQPQSPGFNRTPPTLFSGNFPADNAEITFGLKQQNAAGPNTQPQPAFGVAIMSAIAACCGCCLLVMLGAGIGVGSAVGRLIPKGGA